MRSVSLKLLPIIVAVLGYTAFALLPVASKPLNKQSVEYSALEPTKTQADTSKKILKKLFKSHYKEIILDDALSAKVYDRYLEFLDSSRSYFLESDIQTFEKYKNELDDSMRKGDLEPAFVMFNTLQERRIQRLNYLLNALDQDLSKIDFTKNEYLLTKREDAPWFKDAKEADELWRKELKNSILSLKLSNKTLDEIKTLLKKRYSSQLNRIKQTNSEDVFDLYVSSFTKTLDPHTQYFPPRESENFDINMSLKLEGIGALLQMENEYTKIVRLIHAGPAEKSKLLHPADRIVGVAQGEDSEMTDIVGWRLDDVVDLIRGPKGTTVRLNIIPADSVDEQTKEISLTRDEVKLEEQAAKKRVIDIEQRGETFKVGVIELPTFYIDFKAAQSGDPDYKSSSRDLEKLIKELKQEGINALVIDLRNNGGGSLHEANKVTGLFMRTGPVVQIKENTGYIGAMGDENPKIVYDGPLAVMVNRLSASASEIFAGAIQDTGRGIVVGGQTFGKGTVQTLDPIDSGQLKYTQAMFYRISGSSTQHKGVIPDISFPSLFDKEEIGESTYTGALPWDYIEPIRYRHNPLIRSVVPDLHAQHKQRIKTDPDFLYLQKRINLLEETRNKTQISLNEKKRKQEREKYEKKYLTLENKRREIKGLAALKTFAELEKANEEDKSDSKEIDGLIKETGYILQDLSQLGKALIARQQANSVLKNPSVQPSH